jgi:5-methylcytosine-specific restriction endonuclease McrA
MSSEKQKAAQRASMEKARFGATRADILKAKGAKCAKCGSTHDLVIDHKNGGGRHATENGMLPNNSSSNLQVLCRSCAGSKDAIRGAMGLGIEGNPNNPA